MGSVSKHNSRRARASTMVAGMAAGTAAGTAAFARAILGACAWTSAAGIAGAMVVSVPAMAAVSDFSLPPGPTQTPDVQGPVTDGVAPPRATRTDPAPTASPTSAPPRPAPAPAPAPATAASPAPSPRQTAAPAPSPSPTVAPSPTATPSPASTASGQPAPETDQPAPATAAGLSPAGPAAAGSAADAAIPTAGISADEGWWSGWLAWLAGGIALIAALAGGIWFWQRNNRLFLPAPIVIERPRIPQGGDAAAGEPSTPAFPDSPRPAPAAPEAANPAEAPPVPAPQGSLHFSIEARQMAISLTAATLAYRITLTNSGDTSLNGIAIAGDMISAHASRPQEEQIASPDSPLAPCHAIESIPAGESIELSGEFRLPLPLIQPIRRGDIALFVPLARLRVETAGQPAAVITTTALIGQQSAREGAGLQPFRLDLGPRIYREVTQKIFS